MIIESIIGLAGGITNIVIGRLTKQSAALQLTIDYSKISKNPAGTKEGEIDREYNKLRNSFRLAEMAGEVAIWSGMLIVGYFFYRIALGMAPLIKGVG